MKLYIDNYKTNNLYSKLQKLDIYFANTTSHIEIYSNEGIFIIDDINLYKLKIKDEDIIKITNYYNKFDILIDNSEITKHETNQIPSHNVLLQIITFNYLTIPKSNLKLVITGKYNNTNKIIDDDFRNKYNGFTIIDFYFEVLNNIDINSPLFKEELSVFLSMFN